MKSPLENRKIPLIIPPPPRPSYRPISNRKFLPVISNTPLPPRYKPQPPSSPCCFKFSEKTVYYRNVLCLKTCKAKTYLEHQH